MTASGIQQTFLRELTDLSHTHPHTRAQGKDACTHVEQARHCHPTHAHRHIFPSLPMINGKRHVHVARQMKMDTIIHVSATSRLEKRDMDTRSPLFYRTRAGHDVTQSSQCLVVRHWNALWNITLKRKWKNLKTKLNYKSFKESWRRARRGVLKWNRTREAAGMFETKTRQWQWECELWR